MSDLPLNQILDFIESAALLTGLVFTGVALRSDLRSRHADILIRSTENHRDLWVYYDQNRRKLWRIFDPHADVESKPVTPAEARFIQFFLHHVIVTFRTAELGLYRSPERHGEDMREFFSLPVPGAAWLLLRPYQDRDFVDYLEAHIQTGRQANGVEKG